MQLQIVPSLIQPVMRSLLSGMLHSPLLGHDVYLDPGSGSYLLQLLIAGLVGSAFMVRTFWSRIKAFFTRNSDIDEAEDQADEE